MFLIEMFYFKNLLSNNRNRYYKSLKKKNLNSQIKFETTSYYKTIFNQET